MNASKEAQPFSTDELELGMYVSRLDRPWLETPFLFQGFYIESLEDIEELRLYCKYVYVDVERTDNTITMPRRAAMTVPRGRTPAANGRAVAAAEPERPNTSDTALMKTELVRARLAHNTAEGVVRDLLSKVRSGDDIDITSIQRKLEPMIDSVTRNDDALSWLARMKKKDDYVYDHSIASAVWALIFGKQLGLDRDALDTLAMGAIFMDVGKTRIPTELLRKAGALDPAEEKIMRQHVAYGVEIVSEIDGIDPRIIDMVKHHHERYNGTGYPDGLSGSQIPIFARIAGIIDAYDAMTTRRPYAAPKSPYAAMRQLNKLAGVEFAAEVVEQFVQAIGVFPVGTLVELNTGEVGMVISQNRVRRLRPKIMLLLDREKRPLETFSIVDLRNQLADADGHNSLWIEQGLAPGDYGLDPAEYFLQEE